MSDKEYEEMLEVLLMEAESFALTDAVLEDTDPTKARDIVRRNLDPQESKNDTLRGRARWKKSPILRRSSVRTSISIEVPEQMRASFANNLHDEDDGPDESEFDFKL